MNKNIFLIFHGRFPSEKAASLFTAKNAESFGVTHKVTVLVPRRCQKKVENIFEFYNVKPNFQVVYLPTLDLFGWSFFSKIAFPISYLIFSFSTFFYLLFFADKKSILYSNEHFPLLISSFFFRFTFYEMHDFPQTKSYWYYRFFSRRIRWFLIHNKWKTNKAVNAFGIKKQKVLCELNAVELTDFDISLSKEKARHLLGLANDKKIIVYTGHLYGWKGANILAEAGFMFDSNIMLYFVGGTEKDVTFFKEKYKKDNIIFTGFKKHAEMPIWQAAADLLVIPNTAKEDISRFYTSPMKLFEYMASKRPIVASKIPSIEEIVTHNDVYFFEPDNALSLKTVIESVFSDNEMSNKKINNAYTSVLEHTWEKRANRILSFITTNK